MNHNLWDRSKNLSYIKVGVFFLVAFIILLFTLLSMEELTFFRRTYSFVVSFEFAEGLRGASPVRFCGVDVGEVKSVVVREQNNRPLVYVQVAIDRASRIPKNSYFIINSLSLFGEKYLEITPPEESKGYVQPNDIVAGISPIPLSSIFTNFTKTMQEVSAFVKEGALKDSLERSLANIESITMNINRIMEDTQNKSGTIGRLFYDDSLYQSTEELILDIKANPWKLLNKPRERRR